MIAPIMSATHTPRGRAYRGCRYPGCTALTQRRDGYCAPCWSKVLKATEAKRGDAHERGYTGSWSVASKNFLRQHPLCMCERCGAGKLRVVLATVVDHIVPHRLKQTLATNDPVAIAKAQELFWDQSNWQSMSKACHDLKTATQDGGFGRPLVDHRTSRV